MRFAQVGIPPEDAQFLETRQFQVAEIARIFRLPPHKLQDLEHATFSNIEHLGIEFVVDTLRPWLVRWEQRIHYSLMTEAERSRYFAEFLVDGLLRGDQASRFAAYATARQWGWMSANDVRELENQNPIANGDIYLIPLNMIEAGSPPEMRQAPSEAEIRQAAEDAGIEAAQRRRALASSYKRNLQDVSQRIVNREVNDLRNAGRRYLGQDRRYEWSEWLEGFLAEHESFVYRYLLPVAITYGELVSGEVSSETGQEIRQAEIRRILEEYLASRSMIWIARLGSTVRGVVDGAYDEAADPVEALEVELASREDTAAGSFALDQSIRLNNYVAKAAYALSGIRRLIWRSGSDACPYCRRLNGRTIEISGYFLLQDEDLEPDHGDEEPEGEVRPYRSGSNVGHPPLHKGCDCMATSLA